MVDEKCKQVSVEPKMQIIEAAFERLYHRLKPALKKRAVFILIPEENPIKNSVANTIQTNPPTIRIYKKSFEKLMTSFVHENMKEIITHELIHAIGLDHNGTEEYEHKVEFFDDDK